MSKKLINFVDISKSYGNNLVLDELNLYIRENEFITLNRKIFLLLHENQRVILWF